LTASRSPNQRSPAAIGGGRVLHLSALLGHPVVTRSGDEVGRVDDVIVTLRDTDYPLVSGLVGRVGGRRVYLSIKRVTEFSEDQIVLGRDKVDLRSFERRDGEVLLREDILGHRLIDVAEAKLVRAYDVELQADGTRWVLARLDTRRPARWFGLLRQSAGHASRDWKAFEPLIGHTASAGARGSSARLGRLKPAQIADLIEDAHHGEDAEILDQVHADPELEADVFEELDPDLASRLLGDMTDPEVARLLGRMRADDAADAINDLRQNRRQPILDLLTPGQRAKVLTLLGFHPGSAGGLMSTDVLTCPPDITVGQAVALVVAARTLQPEALSSVHAVNPGGHLLGVAAVLRLVQADPAADLTDLLDVDPVRINPGADMIDVALLMADYNLITIPVVDTDNRILGVVTVDDVLEATIPEDWRRREPAPRPPRPDDPAATGTTTAADIDMTGGPAGRGPRAGGDDD